MAIQCDRFQFLHSQLGREHANGGTIDTTGLYIAPTTGTFPMNVRLPPRPDRSRITASQRISVTQSDPLGTAQGT